MEPMSIPETAYEQGFEGDTAQWKVEWFEDDEWYEEVLSGYAEAERFFENKCDKLIESTGVRPANCHLEEIICRKCRKKGSFPEVQHDAYGIYVGKMCDVCFKKEYRQGRYFDPSYAGETLEPEEY